MLRIEDKYVETLRAILDKVKYNFILKNVRGGTDFIDPWYDFVKMEKVLDKLAIKNVDVIKLFYLGKKIEYNKLIDVIDEKEVNCLIEGNILLKNKNTITTNNLVILIYQGLDIVVEINPWYATCSNKNTDVYIGFDSLRLAENIIFNKDTEVLDLCSGSGIQGMIAAKSAKKVISVELNEKAAVFAKFNAKLNKLQDIMEVRLGDLFSVLNDEKFDYIYANPPFIPMIDGVKYPICGAGGSDGLKVLNIIIDNIQNYLKSNGVCIIFCQCLGDNDNIFFDTKVNGLAQVNCWDVLSVITDKIPLRYQAKTLAELSTLFDKTLNQNDLYNKIMDTYTNLNAKYLYSITYKIDKNYGKYNFDKIKIFNEWNLSNKANILNNVNIVPDNSSYIVTQGDKRLGYFDDEALSIYNMLKKGFTVEETAKILYDKFSGNKKYQRYKLPSFECEVLESCFRMEQLGLIKPGK